MQPPQCFQLLFLSQEWGEDLVSCGDDHILGASGWHFISYQVLPRAHSAQLIKKKLSDGRII